MIAPYGDLEVGIMDYDGMIIALPYPCHRSGVDFVDAANRWRVDIQPTHWRMWIASREGEGPVEVPRPEQS